MSNNCAMPLGLAQEISKQGEARLIALMNLATAADLRATTLCGIFGASAVASGAAVLAYYSSQNPLSNLIWAGSVTSILLFIAAIIAAIAGAPRDFFIAGGNPDSLREWAWNNNKWRDEIEMFDATAQRYADSIKKNREFLESGSTRIIWSLWVAAAAPILGTIFYFAC